MAQTPELSPLKVSPKIVEKPTVKVTPELAQSFKGRIPTGIQKQVIKLNDKRREKKHKQELKERKKERELLRKDNKGSVVQQQRVDAFLEEFLKNGGNATEAAAQVFNVSSRTSAASIGSYYLKKAKMLGRLYLEQKGYSYGRLLSIAAQKAEMSRLPEWWDRVYEISGYGSFRSAKDGGGPVTNVNIIQSEKELFKKYTMTEAEIIEEEPQEIEDEPQEEEPSDD